MMCSAIRLCRRPVTAKRENYGVEIDCGKGTGSSAATSSIARSPAGIAVSALERRYAIDFGEYFREALARLRPLIDDGLVQVDDARIRVTSRAGLLLRNIAMCFDRYLDRPSIPLRFARAI